MNLEFWLVTHSRKMDKNFPLHSHRKKACKLCNWIKELVWILLVIGTWKKRFNGSYGNNKATNTSFDSQGFTDLSDNSSMRSFCHIRHSLVTELDQSRWLNKSYVFHVLLDQEKWHCAYLHVKEENVFLN